MSHVPLSNRNVVVNCPILTEHLNFAFALIELSRRSVSCRLYLLNLTNQIPPHVLKWYYWLRSKFRETPLAEFNFLERQASLAALIQVSRLQTDDKRTVRVLPTDTSYWMNYVLSSVKVLVFTQKQPAAKLLTIWQLGDILLRLKLLNALTTLTHSCCFP